MPLYVEKYTDDQRDAMAHAFEDRKVRPAQRVVDLAARGELEHRGERLAPFEANAESVRHYARLMRKRRAGQVSSHLAEKPHKDATEALRRRLVNAADAMLAHFERVQKRSPEKADPQRLREIARTVLEIKRLDPDTETRVASAGTRDATTGRTGPQTKGGLAGALLNAHRSNGASDDREPLTTSLPNTTNHGDSTPAVRSTADTEHQQHGEDDAPGAWARAQVDALPGVG